MTTCLAVDVGGTKLAVGLVNSDGSVLANLRTPTPRTSNGEHVFATLVQLVDQLLARASSAPTVCGVGCGGPMNRGGTEVSPLNIGAWRQFPLAERLSDAIGLPTKVDNDAKALALAEGWVGAAREAPNYVSLVVSTGIGGGIVLDGRLLEGSLGNAGHIGHVIVEPNGHRCGCGASGCLEAEASGSAIERITGQPATKADRQLVVRTGTMVGRAVASVANLLDLRLAIVGGSVALGFGHAFFSAAQAELDARSRLDFSSGAVIIASALGELGGILGAAAVGFRAVDELGLFNQP